MNRFLLSMIAIVASAFLMGCGDSGSPFGNTAGPKKPASLIADEKAKAAKLAKDPQAAPAAPAEEQPAK